MSHFSNIVKSSSENVRHVLGLSGGKDSAALAIFIKDQYPEIHNKVEYFFSDTGAELPEAYEFLDKLETYLGKPIVRLGTGREFDHWLKVHNDMLPSARARWCTRTMKIKPFEEFVGDDPAISYIGIRADENREGYISTKKQLKQFSHLLMTAMLKLTSSDCLRILLVFLNIIDGGQDQVATSVSFNDKMNGLASKKIILNFLKKLNNMNNDRGKGMIWTLPRSAMSALEIIPGVMMEL